MNQYRVKDAKMKNRLRFSLVIFAIALACFVHILQFDSFTAFAQQLDSQESDVKTNQNSEIGAIHLRKFSIWDKFEIATMAYFNPLGESDKSVIYAYEFADNKDAEEALDNLAKSKHKIPADSWYIGKIETVSNDSPDLRWQPVKLNDFNIDSYPSAPGQILATNWPIPGENSADAYWVPYAEWISLIERTQQ